MKESWLPGWLPPGDSAGTWLGAFQYHRDAAVGRGSRLDRLARPSDLSAARHVPCGARAVAAAPDASR